MVGKPHVPTVWLSCLRWWSASTQPPPAMGRLMLLWLLPLLPAVASLQIGLEGVTL